MLRLDLTICGLRGVVKHVEELNKKKRNGIGLLENAAYPSVCV